VKLVDANVLLNALNEDSRHHEAARIWLDNALVGDEAIGLPWLCLVAFTRLATHPSVFPAPLAAVTALDRVEEWLATPAAVTLGPGVHHIRLWRQALKQTGGGGNLVNDAYLAALALENNATIVTFDTAFARFDSVEWRTPQQLLNQ